MTSITQESLQYHSGEVLNIGWPSWACAHAQGAKNHRVVGGVSHLLLRHRTSNIVLIKLMNANKTL